jgi:hypothetical protein
VLTPLAVQPVWAGKGSGAAPLYDDDMLRDIDIPEEACSRRASHSRRHTGRRREVYVPDQLLQIP